MIKLLVHVFPKQLLDRPHSGIWKDVQSRLLLWEEIGYNVEVLEFDIHAPMKVLSRVPRDAAQILFEYSWWPELMTRLRNERPELRLHVRTINAEALQHLHRFGVTQGSAFERLRTVYGCTRLLWRDRSVAKLADSLLGISDYDDAYYWRRLSRSVNIVSMPYYCPWPWLEPYKTVQKVHSSFDDRSRTVLCLAGTSDRIGKNMVSEFAELRASTASSTGLKDWDFQLTAGLVGTRNSEAFSGLTHLSKDVDIWNTLQSVRAVAVLGRFGYGLKTTIVDAIAAGCHVILSPSMWARLPGDLRPYCVVWNSRIPESIEKVSTRINREPANDGAVANAHRRKMAIDVAMSLFA